MDCVKLQMRLNSFADCCVKPLLRDRCMPFLDCDRSALRTTKRKLIATGKALAKSRLGSGCEIGPNKVSYVVNEWINKMTLK